MRAMRLLGLIFNPIAPSSLGSWMPAKEILYLIVLCGSFAFGVQAMFLGLGGRLIVRYGKRRGRVLMESLILGLCIGGAAVAMVEVMGLEPLYLALWLPVYTGVFGILLRGVYRGEGKRELQVPDYSEDELRKMIERSGLRVRKNEE
jgi:hypothetical protein